MKLFTCLLTLSILFVFESKLHAACYPTHWDAAFIQDLQPEGGDLTEVHLSHNSGNYYTISISTAYTKKDGTTVEKYDTLGNGVYFQCYFGYSDTEIYCEVDNRDLGSVNLKFSVTFTKSDNLWSAIKYRSWYSEGLGQDLQERITLGTGLTGKLGQCPL
jgi:hypothetical protein